MSTVTCPYCRRSTSRSAAQRDHIPPKGIFPRPRPNNLITIPCCQKCHRSFSDGDELLKAMIAMAPYAAQGVEGISDEVKRAFERNPWWRKHLASTARSSETVKISFRENSVQGHRIPLSEKITAAFDVSIQRICIGLLFSRNPEWDSTEHRFDVVVPDPADPSLFIQQVEKLGHCPDHIRVGDNAFIAGWKFAHDSPSDGVMIMTFYGTVNLLVFIRPKNK